MLNIRATFVASSTRNTSASCQTLPHCTAEPSRTHGSGDRRGARGESAHVSALAGTIHRRGPEGLWEVPQVRGRKPEPGLAERIVKATTVTTVSDFTRANTIGRANGASPANQRRHGMRAVRHAGLATLSTPGGPQQEPTGAPILPRGPRGPLSLGQHKAGCANRRGQSWTGRVV